MCLTGKCSNGLMTGIPFGFGCEELGVFKLSRVRLGCSVVSRRRREQELFTVVCVWYKGYLLQRKRDKRRAIVTAQLGPASQVMMSPGETPRDGYNPASHVH